MKKHHIAIATSLLLLPTLAEAQFLTEDPFLENDQWANLTVLVHGLKTKSGTVEVSLFDTADSFLKTPIVQQSVTVEENKEISTSFVDLLVGDYAIVVVHDENDDGVLDTGILGFGGESYGYSNNVKPWLGRPDFEAVKFTVSEEDLEIVISLE